MTLATSARIVSRGFPYLREREQGEFLATLSPIPKRHVQHPFHI